MVAERRAFLSHAPAATEALGEALGGAIGPGTVVSLEGEFGAGKTTFVRGLARGLGIEDAVTSPSFTLMHEYEGRVPLYHFDAWMAGREAALLEDGAQEYLGGEGVAVIEWGGQVERYLPRPRLEVRFEHRGPSVRGIELGVVRPGTGAGSGAPPEGTGRPAEALAAALAGLAGGPELEETAPSR